MSDRCFVDTNILMYAHDTSAGEKHERAKALVEGLWRDRTGVVSTQVLQELAVNLRKKARRPLDAGATRAITQFFFDPDIFLRFRDQCAAAGIEAAIVPGILPITRFPHMLRFAQRCGANVPEWLVHRFDGIDDDPVRTLDGDTSKAMVKHITV